MNQTLELGLTRWRTMSAFSIREFSQPPNRRLPWHEHREASICFVLSGSYLERIGGVERACAAHSMVFKPASERHADQFGRMGGRCLLIEIDSGRLDGIEPLTPVTARPRFVRNATLAALGSRIYREFVWGDDLSPLAVEALVLEVLVEASRAVMIEPARLRPRWLRQAHDLIHDRFCQPLTLSSIAGAVGVHPSHLARTFRRRYRRSIGEYVRKLRIERAVTELADTDAPLAAIGLRSGFFDQSHFSRVFKLHTGMTPAQFRAASQTCTSRTNPRPTS